MSASYASYISGSSDSFFNQADFTTTDFGLDCIHNNLFGLGAGGYRNTHYDPRIDPTLHAEEESQPHGREASRRRGAPAPKPHRKSALCRAAEFGARLWPFHHAAAPR
jgi:hypothetical protein